MTVIAATVENMKNAKQKAFSIMIRGSTSVSTMRMRPIPMMIMTKMIKP